MNAATPYLLDNAQRAAGSACDVLAKLFDATTQRALAAPGGETAGTVSKWAAAAARWRAGWRSGSRPRAPCCAPISIRGTSKRRRCPEPAGRAARHRARCVARGALRSHSCAAGAAAHSGAGRGARTPGNALQAGRMAGDRGFRCVIDAARQRAHPARSTTRCRRCHAPLHVSRRRRMRASAARLYGRFRDAGTGAMSAPKGACSCSIGTTVAPS